MAAEQSPNIIHAAALDYAARGWPVIPLHSVDDAGVCTCRSEQCTSKGKHPRTRHGLKDASVDAACIATWWRTWPRANVGVVTGGGRFVLDVDPEHGGDAALRQLEAEHTPLERTYEVITGRGGRHLYFTTGGGGVANSTSLIGPGLDIRGDGGYVVAPPSRTQWAYCIDAGGADEPTPAPSWLEAMVRRRRPSMPADSGSDGPAAYMAGGRNNKLTSLGGSMRKRGMCYEAIEAALLTENAARCRPPLDEAEVKRIANSVMRYAPGVSAGDGSGGDGSGGGGGDDGGTGGACSRNARGKIEKTFGNVCKILRADGSPELSYDEMRMTPLLAGKPLLDVDMSRVREQLEKTHRVDFGGTLVKEAILTVADETHVHPVKDYLDGLTWDGKERIARVPADVLGMAVDSLTTSMLRRWFVSAVARIFQPGCQVDTVLVLVGKQGAKKSTFFRDLASPWFGESRMDTKNKDAVLQLYSAWIYEWPEIDQITLGRDASEIKGFLTQQTDSIRKPYASGVFLGSRHTVIVGTTNQDAYLDDETGARRFWTLSMPGKIDIERLREWRDQLWAEAVIAYRDGEQWWLDAEEDTAQVAHSGTHAVGDPWVDVIGDWLTRGMNEGECVSSSDIMTRALHLLTVHQTKGAQRRIGACMKALGYRRSQDGAGRRKVWVSVNADERSTT